MRRSSYRQGSVLDDALHDQRGAEALDAGKGGEAVVVDLLESGQVTGDDAQQIVRVAEEALGLHHVGTAATVQRAEFPSAAGSPVGVLPTWDDLVEHTLDATHRGWGDRLWVPLSTSVDVGRTRPRLLLELRRLGFAAVDRKRWKPLMLRIHDVTRSLNS
jgi:hypothetical protein